MGGAGAPKDPSHDEVGADSGFGAGADEGAGAEENHEDPRGLEAGVLLPAVTSLEASFGSAAAVVLLAACCAAMKASGETFSPCFPGHVKKV